MKKEKKIHGVTEDRDSETDDRFSGGQEARAKMGGKRMKKG